MYTTTTHIEYILVHIYGIPWVYFSVVLFCSVCAVFPLYCRLYKYIIYPSL